MKKTIIILLILSGLSAIPFIYDIMEDRNHKIIIKAKINVYSEWEPYPRNEQPLFTITTNDTAEIKRIRYGKDYMAIKIKTANGKYGWVFNGPSVSVN